MEKSESIAKLSEALSKVQSVLKGAAMDSSNPFFNSKYADLTSVWDACRKPLADNGLAVIQVPSSDDTRPEYVIIETILSHSSGEWVKGRLVMKPTKPDPQSVGSCITYARRYSLASIVGIAPEDDDGNAASGNEKQKQEPKGSASKPAEKPPKPPDESAIIEGMKKKLNGMMKGLHPDERKELFASVIKEPSVDALQDFIDRFDEYKQKYMERRATGKSE